MARRSKKTVAKKDSGEEALEALELVEQPYVPPRPIALLLLLATLGAFTYLVSDGIRDAQAGRPRLAGKLLAVEERDQTPLQFDLSKIDGGRVSLNQFRDKVVLINFWATWCPPCIEEMPSMLRLHDKLKNDPRFVMLVISTDDSWDPVKKFFGEDKPGFTVLLDPKGEIAKQYGSTMFPETYVVVDGRLEGFIEGPRNWDAWYAETYLRGLLAGG